MKDTTLYQQILGLSTPWHVAEVKLDLPGNAVTIMVRHKEHHFRCPECNQPCGIHDHRTREWRHLDSCQLKTKIVSEVPRIRCPKHGVKMVDVPWAEAGSRFTALFEALVLHWLQAANFSDVAERMQLTWDQVDGIQGRGVSRGMKRRQLTPMHAMGIDETSFKKGHDYVVAIVDRDKDIVVDVLSDRKKATLKSWLNEKPEQELAKIRTVSMDMCPAFINATLESVPEAATKICFDRFHVAQHFCKAVNKVRAKEHKELQRTERGEKSPLTGTKHEWLYNGTNIDNRGRPAFMKITRMNLKTSRAWAIKETASSLWDYTYRGAAENAWTSLLGWTARSRLEPMVRVGRTVKGHLWGILNAIEHKVTNAAVEGKNAAIQRIKKTACGFRNKERFRRAILFHLGGLNMLPDVATGWIEAHPKS